MLDQPQATDPRAAAQAEGGADAASPPYGRLNRLPPQSFFLVSAVFHYLGPSLAACQLTLSEEEVRRLEEPYVPHQVLAHS